MTLKGVATLVATPFLSRIESVDKGSLLINDMREIRILLDIFLTPCG